MAKNIIVNGNFYNPSGPTYGWIAHNVSIKKYEENNFERYYLDGGTRNTYYDIPPGIYQKIDISNYAYDVRLDIEYTIHYNKDVAASKPEEDLISNFYIYELSSYDSTTKIPVKGEAIDYIYKNNAKIYYNKNDILNGLHIAEEDSVTITLSPGYYIIGFGANFIDINGAGFIADGTDLNGFCIEHIEVMASGLDSGVANLLSTSDFENHGVILDIRERDKSYSCPDSLEDTDVCIRVSSNNSLEASMSYKDGLGAYFNIQGADDIIDAVGRISFWYRSSLENAQFAVCIYDTSLNSRFYSKTITISAKNKWVQCNLAFNAWDGDYLLLIIPPKESYNSDLLFLNKIRCKVEMNTASSGQGGEGTWEEPYNKYDGYISYELEKNGTYTCFFNPTNATVRDGLFYVKINNRYYMSYEGYGHFENQLCINGFYDSNGQKVSKPSSTTDLRYFFSNGAMAVNESFAYGDDIYTGNSYGICSVTSQIMKDITLTLKGFTYPIRSTIDVPRGSTNTTIIASFARQNPYIKLDVTSSDDEIVSASVVSTNDTSGYNESNTIQIQAWHLGTALITVSYTNLDGTIISKSFEVDVRDIREYGKANENVNLEFLYDLNYMSFNEELDLKHKITPLASSNLPLDFQVVEANDRQIFSITQDGVLSTAEVRDLAYPHSCTVYMTNYGSKKTTDCVIRLTAPKGSSYNSAYKKRIPVGIRFNNMPTDMNVGQVIDVKAETYGEDNTSVNITQNVSWSSSNASVVMVNDYGTFTALSAGETTITCTCVEDPYVKTTVKIKVTGDATGDEFALQRIDLNMKEAVLLGSNVGDASGKMSCEFLEYTLFPGATQQKNVIWSSDNDSLVKVDQSGKIYCNRGRTYGADFKESTYVRCTSAHNPNISAACKVTACSWGTYHPIIYFSDSQIDVYVDEQVTIPYGRSNCSYIEYEEDICNVTIKKADGSSLGDAGSFSYNKNAIYLTLKEEGTYIITASCNYKKGNLITYSLSKTCTIKAKKSDLTPFVTKNLELCYALHNGTCIMRYHVKNNVRENFTHFIGVGGKYYSTDASPLIYNNEDYYYIFDEEVIKHPGEYEVCVRVVNNGIHSCETNSIKVTMPEIKEDKDKQISLSEAKYDYDKAINDIIGYLENLINDGIITKNEDLEFDTRYKIFNHNYENLKHLLDVCIKYIDEQIKAEQAEMSTMATVIASDGTAIATYSMGDVTNSNYKNVTDMDYYQNECIKSLVQKVLELEAKLNELANNNNN